jgi:hypothetical protein
VDKLYPNGDNFNFRKSFQEGKPSWKAFYFFSPIHASSRFRTNLLGKSEIFKITTVDKWGIIVDK